MNVRRIKMVLSFLAKYLFYRHIFKVVLFTVRESNKFYFSYVLKTTKVADAYASTLISKKSEIPQEKTDSLIDANK